MRELPSRACSASLTGTVNHPHGGKPGGGDEEAVAQITIAALDRGPVASLVLVGMAGAGKNGKRLRGAATAAEYLGQRLEAAAVTLGGVDEDDRLGVAEFGHWGAASSGSQRHCRCHHPQP
jgi:hypothetical protein